MRREITQGVPVRNRQRTPSRKRRLSTAVRPGSVTLPGHSGATRAHISSVKLCDLNSSCHLPRLLVPPFSACNTDTNTRPALKTQGNCQRALVILRDLVIGHGLSHMVDLGLAVEHLHDPGDVIVI